MNKEKKQLIIIILTTVLIIMGIVLASVLLIKKTVYIDDAFDSCIQANGIYSVHYNDFSEKYVVNCTLPEREIFKFYIEQQ